MRSNDHQIKKALVAFTVEKTLLDMGKPVLDAVSKKLLDDYRCYLPDCYDHPEYLKRILSELFGNAHVAIVNSIKNDLDEFSQQAPIHQFIVALS